MAKANWEEEGGDSMQAESGAQNRAGNQEGGDPGMEAGGGSTESGGESGMRENWQEESEASSVSSYGSAAQLQQYLRGMNYPAGKQDMIEAARSNSAPEDFMSFMNKLPEKTYNAPEEVEEEFGKIK